MKSPTHSGLLVTDRPFRICLFCGFSYCPSRRKKMLKAIEYAHTVVLYWNC